MCNSATKQEFLVLDAFGSQRSLLNHFHLASNVQIQGERLFQENDLNVYPRALNSILSDFMDAGWLRKHSPHTWSITSAGREAKDQIYAGLVEKHLEPAAA